MLSTSGFHANCWSKGGSLRGYLDFLYREARFEHRIIESWHDVIRICTPWRVAEIWRQDPNVGQRCVQKHMVWRFWKLIWLFCITKVPVAWPSKAEQQLMWEKLDAATNRRRLCRLRRLRILPQYSIFATLLLQHRNNRVRLRFSLHRNGCEPLRAQRREINQR